MRLVAATLATCGLVLGAAAALASDAGAADARALRRLECEWAAAIVGRDTLALQKLIAPDFTLVFFEGTIADRDEEIGAVATGASRFSAIRLGEMRVRLLGDAAVVVSRTAREGTLDGEDLSGTYVQTHVWARHAGGWRAVSAQSTRVLALDPSSVRVTDECGAG